MLLLDEDIISHEVTKTTHLSPLLGRLRGFPTSPLLRGGSGLRAPASVALPHVVLDTLGGVVVRPHTHKQRRPGETQNVSLKFLGPIQILYISGHRGSSGRPDGSPRLIKILAPGRNLSCYESRSPRKRTEYFQDQMTDV